MRSRVPQVSKNRLDCIENLFRWRRWRLITLKRRYVSTVKELSQFQLFRNWNIQSYQEICLSQGLGEHTTPCCSSSLKEILFLLINPFHATDLFWYPLKTSENQRFSDVFRGYQKRSVAWNGLKMVSTKSALNYDCLEKKWIN